MTLSQLKKLTGEIFSGAQARLPAMLAAWGRKDPEGELARLLTGTGIDSQGLAAALEPLVADPLPEDGQLLIDCIRQAQGTVTGRDLLHVLCDHPGHRISRALTEAGLDLGKLRANLDDGDSHLAGPLRQIGIKVDASTNPMLQYGRDLTTLAASGAFDDLCERPEELDQLEEVLQRKTKGNAAITGKAGVGKTSLVELLARQVVRGEVPPPLQEIRIVEVEMGKVVAGTRYRGDFEERLKEIIQAAENQPDTVLFVDEMHLIWGAGRAEGIITDASNMLKPALARGNLRMIGATTVEEYQRYIARDAALERRFQEVRLEEPSGERLLGMIRKQAASLENHHGIGIPGAVIQQAVELTDRHRPNRFQPDKSVDLLDSAAVRAVREGREEVLISDLLNVLARQTGRSIAALTGEGRQSLRDLADRLKERVIGQERAIDKVVATLVQRRQGLGDSSRNLGTFLFAGDTGVGKTELARSISEQLYGSGKLLHLDMAEFNQPGSVNRLIGSPPGFAGSEEDGDLGRWYHAHGSGVILLDEIEKAHPDIHRLILGLLDSGRITSARGETIDTRQCVVILTTNALTPSQLQGGRVGFGKEAEEIDPLEILEAYFPREFLGRLDEVILFDPLHSEQMRKIMRLRLGEALERLAKKGIRMSFDENRLLDYLLSRLERNRTGARGIVRLLEVALLQPVASRLLFHEDGKALEVELGDTFYEKGEVTVIGGKLK